MTRKFWSVVLLAVLLSLVTVSAYGSSALVANTDQACLIKVIPTDAAESNRFGSYVALSNETMVVARSGYDGNAAYVFVRNAQGWAQQQKIAVSTHPRCVAIQGDTLAIGLTGEVQVWVRTAGIWSLQARLADTGTAAVDSVAIDGETLVAGSASSPSLYTGTAFVYVREGGTWSLQQKLRATTETTSPYLSFGLFVDVEGDRLVVGAPQEGMGDGAAYVFGRAGSVWTQQARLAVPGGAALGDFGCKVVLDGDQLAIGADGWSAQMGAVYIWEYNGSSWAMRQRIIAPDGRGNSRDEPTGDCFGLDLGLAGDTLIVGSPADDDKGADSGSLYVLRRVEGTWVFQRKIIAPDEVAGDLFGLQIAVDAGRVAVASPFSPRGSVYAFDLGFVTPAETTLTVSAPGVLVNDAMPDLSAIVAFKSQSPLHGRAEMAPDSGFTYTPSSRWKGADQFKYACTDGVATSNAATVIVQTWQPTKLAFSASDSTPRCGGTMTLRATLKTVDGARVANRPVIVEVQSGSRWVSMGSFTTGSTGVVSRTVSGLTTARTYRVRTPWSSAFGAAGSSWVRITPHVNVTAPSGPSIARRKVSFSTKGYLKPRHVSGGRPVKLCFYRYESGAWVLKKNAWPMVKDCSDYSKYSTSVALGVSGRWRVRAYHPADSVNAATWSSSRYFTVR